MGSDANTEDTLRPDLEHAIANGGVRKALARRILQALEAGSAEIDRLRLELAEKDGPREREKLPRQRSGVTRKFAIRSVDGVVDVYCTANAYDDGRIGEVFLTVGKQGELAHGLCEAFGTVLSIALQHGVPLSAFTSKLRGTIFAPAGLTHDTRYPTAKSVLDILSCWLDDFFPGGLRAQETP